MSGSRLGVALAALLLLPAVAQAQGAGPRSLFPGMAPSQPETVAPDAPPPATEASPTAETVETPPVGEVQLAAPGLGARGLDRAQEALGGPLWAGATPAGLAEGIARLPARVDDPTLHRLQRDLLLAPGPVSDAGPELVRARIERLLAMGEAGAAAELLATLPDVQASQGLDDLRLETMLAADRIEPGCAMADQAGSEAGIWPEAQLVCAAVRNDRARVELGLSLMGEQGRPAGPLLTSLLLATGGGERVVLREPPPPDPLLLPLLRRAPLQPEAKALAGASPAVRQAVAQNPNVPAGLAPPVVSPPAPPGYPGLNGQAPTDWRAAGQAVPDAMRARWLAALDGLGIGPPDAVLAALPAGSRTLSGGRVDLAAWRALERAGAEVGRGPVLLAVLILLDGRPAEASPLALRAGVAALRGLKLDEDARSLAAAGLAGRSG